MARSGFAAPGTVLWLVPGGTVGDYPPAKTAADRFKLRNKIGVDVALEGLRECRSLQKASMDLERMLFRLSKSKPAYSYPEGALLFELARRNAIVPHAMPIS